MSYADESNFAKATSPYVQAGGVLACIVSLLLLAKISDLIGLTSPDITLPWTLSASFLLFFVIFNSVFSLSAKEDNSYWVKSFLAFAGLASFSGILAYMISGLGLGEIGGYKWIYIVITFTYLVFISIIGFMKRIVQFAQKEEWTKPMRKSKKR